MQFTSNFVPFAHFLRDWHLWKVTHHLHKNDWNHYSMKPQTPWCLRYQKSFYWRLLRYRCKVHLSATFNHFLSGFFYLEMEEVGNSHLWKGFVCRSGLRQWPRWWIRLLWRRPLWNSGSIHFPEEKGRVEYRIFNSTLKPCLHDINICPNCNHNLSTFLP